ncbi:MAG: hypothetical protein MRY57_02235 [Candidatus Pacebacteria bacterium]|nr:hypothetical protein [Candidatus Paceibacterota bacterium]
MVCDKVTYTTQGDADRAAAGHSRAKHGNFSSYRCDKCDYWHLTSGRKNLLNGTPRKKFKKGIQKMKMKFRRMRF